MQEGDNPLLLGQVLVFQVGDNVVDITGGNIIQHLRHQRFSYKGEDVVATLERVCRQHGTPQSIRVDQGSEFISRDLDLWAYQNSVVLDFSRPGKPTDNAFIESFNGKFRAECLNAHWFMSLDDARAKMEEWRKDYNEVRPHSAIGNKPPVSRINGSGAPPPL